MREVRPDKWRTLSAARTEKSHGVVCARPARSKSERFAKSFIRSDDQLQSASEAGSACHDDAQTDCTNVAYPNAPIAIQVQNDLHAEVSKWTQDLDPLKTYPIIKAGVTYSFSTRRR
ncbi:MAG: hypothetical protein WBQ95_05220 [Terracidiphilus sp.]